MTSLAVLHAIIATPDRFKQWIEGKEAHEVIGECGDTARCPLAAWLASEGVVNGSVGKYDIEGRIDGQWFQVMHPHWMARLVKCVDAKGQGMPIRRREIERMLVGAR